MKKSGIYSIINKLNWQKVFEIREKYCSGFYTTRLLAKEYNVGNTTIKHVVRNETWIIKDNEE